MKDDVSQDKKRGQTTGHDAPEGLDLSLDSPFATDEEDEDFEILDALEHMERITDEDEKYPTASDQTIELTLDDELILDDNNEAKENEFRFDEQISSGLEQELLEESQHFDLDTSFEGAAGDAESGDDAFVLDLNEEEKNDDAFDISFESEAELELDTGDFDLHDEMAFDLNEEADNAILDLNSSDDDTFEPDEGEDDFSLDPDFASSVGEQEDDDEALLVPEDDREASMDESAGSGLGFEPDNEEDAFSLLSETSEEAEFSDDIDIEIDDDFADLRDDILDDDESFADVGLEDFSEDETPEEFTGKTVITLDDDEVIDLGTEEELEETDDFALDDDDWAQDETETTKMFMTSKPEESEREAITKPENEMPDTEFDIASLEEEQDDFMTSFDDIDLDLESEATKMLEEADSMAPFDFNQDETTSEGEQDFDLDLSDEDDAGESELFEQAMSDEEAEQLPEMSAISEELPEDGFGLEESPEISPVSQDMQPEMPEEAEPSTQNPRDFLGLTLQISDAQMASFEVMLNEAQTLQNYLDGLGTHKSEIKENIYHKLSREYITRQKEIFRHPECVNILSDVKTDLDDMLATREEFAATSTRLHEELEEITVRHLVGEYDEALLAEKTSGQQTEIAHWDEKIESIERLITRYRQALSSEEQLNPLRAEPDAEETRVADVEPSAPPSEEEDVVTPVSADEEPMRDEEELSIEDDFLSEQSAEFAESDEKMFDEMEFPGDDDISEEEEDLDIEALSQVAEQFAEGLEESTPEVPPGFFEEEQKQETAQEDVISCKKCGRQTPASEKFCVHCGAKAQ